MNLHQEHHFEAEICASLAENGWLYAEGDAALFDRTSGLFMPDLLAWMETTQLESWQRLNKPHGAALPQVLAERVRKSLNERGTLEVLRRGVELLDLKEPLMLAQFKPALAINPVTQAHYAANRWRCAACAWLARSSTLNTATSRYSRTSSRHCGTAPVAGLSAANQWTSAMPSVSSRRSAAVAQPCSVSNFLGTRWSTLQLARRFRDATIVSCKARAALLKQRLLGSACC